MKIIFIIIALILFISTGTDHRANKKLIYNTIYSQVKASRTGNSHRKTDIILKMADKYKIDPFILNNIIKTESSYNHRAKHIKSGCMGLGGINPKLWNHLLYKIDNGDLGRYIKKNNIKNTDRYFFRIAYNTEAIAIILRAKLAQYGGDYKKTIIFYGGYAGKYGITRRKSKKKYINKILGITI